MSLHIVVGAGAVGARAALLLARRGERVRLVSRGGRGVDHPAVEAISADASNAGRMTEIARGARAIHHCAMPAYDRWPEEFPPISRALLEAAEANRAIYLMVGNAYGYGPVEGAMTENLPMNPSTRKGRVRADMWREALAAHAAGRVRVAEVRGSDYLGRDAASLFTLMVLPRLLAGEPASVPADLDLAHSWTYTGDVAETLVAVSMHAGELGRAWHVPSSTASVRELSTRICSAAAKPPPRLTRMTDAELAALAKDNSLMNEVVEMTYLFTTPSLLDSSVTERLLGVRATPLEDVVKEQIEGYRPFGG